MRPELNCLLVIAVLAAPARAADGVPEAVQPFVPFVEGCARYDRLIATVRWQTTFERTFDADEKPDWTVSSAESQGVDGDLVDVDGRHVLRMTVDQGRGFVHLNAEVKGDFAVEFVGRSVSERPCDLSIVVDGTGAGPAFQFGANYNARNLIFSDAGESSGAGRFLGAEVSRQPLIQPNVWHTVRMEVRGRRVYGFVDGKPAGELPLSESYDLAQARKPMIYAYNSIIEVDRVRLETPDEAPAVDQAEALRAAFGAEADAAAVAARLDDLGSLLDADDFATREAAQRLLQEAGSLAHGTIRRLAADGTAEQRWRARKLAGSLGLEIE